MILVLFVFLISAAIFLIANKPIRNIVIKGTNLISDVEIMRAAGIMNYPPIFRIRRNNLVQKISEIDLVENVRISRNLRFQLIVEVEEAKMILYNSTNNQVLLSSGRYIERNDRLLSMPTLINFAPEAVLIDFARTLGNLDYGIIGLISEIEYSPMVSSEGFVIDSTRFILYMNDGNQVYTNALRAGNLEFYKRIFASLEGGRGIIYLDSANNFIFRDFNSLDVVQ